MAVTPAGGTNPGEPPSPQPPLQERRPLSAVEAERGAAGTEGGQEPRSTEGEGLAPRRRLTAGRSDVEDRGRGRSGCLGHHGELLEEKLVPHSMEGGKGHGPLDESLQVAVAGAEATQRVQHQGTVGDRLAEVAKGVCHSLHLATVLPHEEIPLR
jgi:hypothetical protein